MDRKTKEQFLKKAFDDYFEILVLNAQKYVYQMDEAEEIVQDVFVRFWEQSDTLPLDMDIKAYLFRAVHNSCKNYLRHKKVIIKYQERIKSETTDKVIENKDDLESKELIETLHKAINSLPEHWLEVFLMNRFEGLKYREIAVKLSISQKTVEKYMSKSIQHLQRNLKDYFPFILLLIKYL